MASLFKLIWRFDFEPSYGFLNRRGDILRVLSDEVPDFLTNLKFNDVNGLAGEGRDDSCRRNITMDVTSLAGTLDFLEDVPLEAAFKTSAFRSSDAIARELFKIGPLAKIKRGGIRFFVGFPVSSNSRAHSKFVSDWSLAVSSECFGNPADVAAVVEGRGSDGLSYRFQYGSLEKKNIEQLFATPLPDHAIAKATSSKWVLTDIDLYEKDFSLLAPSLFKWASTKLAKVENLTKLLENKEG